MQTVYYLHLEYIIIFFKSRLPPKNWKLKKSKFSRKMSRWSWFAEILEIKKSDEKSDEKCSQVQSERSKGVKVDDPLSWRSRANRRSWANLDYDSHQS